MYLFWFQRPLYTNPNTLLCAPGPSQLLFQEAKLPLFSKQISNLAIGEWLFEYPCYSRRKLYKLQILLNITKYMNVPNSGFCFFILLAHTKVHILGICDCWLSCLGASFFCFDSEVKFSPSHRCNWAETGTTGIGDSFSLQFGPSWSIKVLVILGKNNFHRSKSL